ncbi:MAG: HupE/UreJ family protein [Proteobacteria bacterium]|nr:HupE/UreJ family protein [Pseudomonadota bacterium]
MTEAIAEIDQSGHISISLQLDLLAEFGSAEAYFAASLSDSRQAPDSEMFIRLAGAIEVLQEDSNIKLRVTGVQWPSGYDLGDYKAQIVWPKTTVKLTGKLNSNAPLAIRFTSAFIFEEPVALTMRSPGTGKSKSRWLVAGQTSPRFDPGNLEIEATDISLEDSVRQGVDFAVHGFRHIVIGGWDHLLFLLALCLSARSACQLITRISLFTLAHTVTLAMASYRLIELNAYWVELAIIGSIVFVAINSLWRTYSPRKTLHHSDVAIAPRLFDATAVWIFLFGLLHGLGFASSLQALEIPTDHFLISLLGFNLGVEVAQIGFVLVVVGIFAVLDRQRAAQAIRRVLSWLTALVACSWLIVLAVQF